MPVVVSHTDSLVPEGGLLTELYLSWNLPLLSISYEQSVQDGPGGDSTVPGAWSKPEAEADITLLSRPQGLIVTHRAEHHAGQPQPRQSLQNISKAGHPLSKGVPTLTSGLLSQKIQRPNSGSNLSHQSAPRV